MIHNLKSDPEQFQKLVIGTKKFEFRKNDRGFQTGDTLLLEETTATALELAAGRPLEYTGKTFSALVTDVLYGPAYGLPEGYCILSLHGGFLTVPEKI